MTSWENWQKLATGEILTKVRSLCGSGQKRTVKFYFVPSSPNSDGRKKKMCVLVGLPIEANKFALEYPLVVDSFSPRDTYCLLVCLVLYPENLTWQLSGWGPQNTARQKYRLHPICIWLGSCQLFPAFRGIAFVSVILEW